MIGTEQAYVIELMLENELRYSGVDSTAKYNTFKTELLDILEQAYDDIMPENPGV